MRQVMLYSTSLKKP